MSPTTQTLLLDMLEEHYNKLQGTIIHIEHQLSLPEEFRIEAIDDVVASEQLKLWRRMVNDLQIAKEEIKDRDKESTTKDY